MIACKEIAPNTGHEHIHIYCQFTSPKRLSLKKLCGCHVEICRGSPQSNVDYIKKDGNIIFEQGELRHTGAKSIKDVKELSKTEREELDVRYYNIVEKINGNEQDDIDIDTWHKDVKVIYIYGKSGSGKSLKAYELAKEYGYQKVNIVKYVNGFWMGVGDSKLAIYDEFRPSHMTASEFLNFIDYNIHILNIKGGKKQNLYEIIIITSIFHPREIYSNLSEEDKTQWLRRITILEITPYEDPNINFDIDFDMTDDD